MSEIKERPILFSAPMVRAILEDRKTVTRRAVRAGFNPDDLEGTLSANECRKLYRELPQHFGASYFCPYGQPGDRLWVRETFALLGNEDGCCIDWQDNLVKGDERGAARIYRASCPPGDYGLNQIPAKAEWKPDTEAMEYDGAWRPSIHMPRWACRILLEITDVRVERLQDITYEQAAAEGVHRGPLREWCASDEGGACHKYPIPAFRDLWQSVGGSWDANPWVWVVEFKRVTP
ncbi:morphogenetic protein [Pseudomonas veronii]|uniref:Morphogenetic protein n=1 Tax=Pseudomonas veronii TaxID=76761 RepID=A0A7Y1ABG0_PSEVE|nr:morphogenetic protein [Pseudomonas veronii]NMY12690.1 morphogenetic protein [Pseudomonas veronii]RWA27968.1 morphogenetic protein [Pseudomonas veronii]